jgi:Ca-activated chloride channel family protein
MEPNDEMKALSADEALHSTLCALALGELHGDEARALEARLASEPALAAQYEQLRATIALVRTSLVGAEALPEVLPEAHLERVLSGARAQAAPVTPIHDLAWYRRPAVRLAASLVLCAGAGFVGLRLMQTPADEGGSYDSTQLGRRDALANELGDAGVPRLEEANDVSAARDAVLLTPAWVSVVPGAEAKAKTADSAGAHGSVREQAPQPGTAIGGSVDGFGITELESVVTEGEVKLEQVTAALEVLAARGFAVGGAVEQLHSNAAGQPSAGFFFDQGPGAPGNAADGSTSFLSAQSTPRGSSAASGAAGSASSGAAAPGSTGDAGNTDSYIIARLGAEPGGSVLDLDGFAVTGQAEELGRKEARELDARRGGGGGGGRLGEEVAGGERRQELIGLDRLGIVAPAVPPVADARTATEETKSPAADFDRDRKKVAGVEPTSEPPSQPPADGRAVDQPGLETAHDDFSKRLRDYRDDDQGGNPRLTDEQLTRVVEQEWRRLHAECQRHPNERPRDMYFRFWGDNAFVRTGEDAQSTFGADVDTASYALARRYLREGRAPERAQIRTEEFVNAFTPDLAPPAEETFGLHVELAPTPFGEDTNHWLVRVGVRGKELAKGERQPLNLTFVVDTSGSMREQNRLELVKHAMRLLVSQLDDRDTIAIVAYANDARQILAPTSAAHRDLIESAIHPLSPNGSTNAEAGLRMGYALAETTLAPGAHSRVVFLSDGVANVGQTDQDRINGDVKRFRDAGIFLNTIGVGMNNHNDAFLEQLANKGDGICDYVDDGAAAEKAIVERFTGAFVPIASDVKLQVEFDPTQVLRWRQLGYENRAIADHDFRNDKIDAGEVGAGHQVTCLYEVELADELAKQDPAKALATLRVRWKAPKGARQDPHEIDVFEREATLSYRAAAGSFRAASVGFRRSALAAQFAEFLRRSSHARMDDYAALAGEVLALIEASPRAAAQGSGASGSFTEELVELADLVRRADGLGFGQRPPVTDLERTLDEYRRYQYQRAILQELRSEGDPLLRQIEDLNRTLEQQIRDLLRRGLEQRRG